MQITVDGFVAGPNGELDWMTWDNDDKLIARINEITDSSDRIVMGRKMTDGFINYWTSVQPDSPEYEFAQKMINIPKVVFSRTLESSSWVNTTVANDIKTDIAALKEADGKDIVVYGGAGLVTSLVGENLIDDYFLFVNPTAIGKGMTIFADGRGLKLIDSTAYACGIVINHYQPAK
jgi:dihydrofolate reductase